MKKVRRIVLGVGHPWYSNWKANGYTQLQLTKDRVQEFILFRGGEPLVPFKIKNTGNYNKVRLVLEVLE